MDIQKVFEKYTPIVDTEIKELLAVQENLLMYDMMSYFFGYLDGNLEPTDKYGGKRFRPGITLLLSDFFGFMNEAIPVAAAIEIFHNFTLIHDDVEDRDEYRRGREAVWKKWGFAHGINTGDAQLILANHELQKVMDADPKRGIQIQKYLNQKFLEIAEGQFKDFQLSAERLLSKVVNEDSILEMIGRKSGVLVGASAVVAGMIAGKSEKEIKALWNYGFNLGLTYQLCDDIVGIWGAKGDTGKDELIDLREKKKTLPIIYARDGLQGSERDRFEKLYDKDGELSNLEIGEVKSLIDKTDARPQALKEASARLAVVNEAIKNLKIKSEEKDLLFKINDALFGILKEGEKVAD